MPPCGSPLISTMKSVPLPVSLLAGSSEMMREEPGETTSAMRTAASSGMPMRSRAAFAATAFVMLGSALRLDELR